MHGIVGADELQVNSAHHQAVDKPAPGTIIGATAPDGVIEGIEYPAHPFCLGVQWHPEWDVANSPFSMALFRSFGEAARKRRALRG